MSLYSRAFGKPRTCDQSKIRGFLALPGELRNNVYRYYFQEDFRCEIVGKSTDLNVLRSTTKLNHKAATQSTIRVSRRLGKYTMVKGLQTSWSRSLCALLFVCKQIHRESIICLYHNTIFVFNAPRRINNFLETFPATNLALVTRLELHYANYGNPGEAKLDYLKDRSLATWARACKAMAKQLVNLRELRVWMYITDSPLFFDLRQQWLTALLPFRRLCVAQQNSAARAGPIVTTEKTSKGLESVNIHFNTWWSRT
jgi:hypothetical protein